MYSSSNFLRFPISDGKGPEKLFDPKDLQIYSMLKTSQKSNGVKFHSICTKTKMPNFWGTDAADLSVIEIIDLLKNQNRNLKKH